MVQGKRYQVFSTKRDEKTEKNLFVKAGSAWVNRDGSVNVYLDVLPLDGKLHIREAVDTKREGELPANGSSGFGSTNSNTNQQYQLGGN